MDLPFKTGLKLHSTNIELIPDAIKLYREDFFNYIELFIVPGSYEETIDAWKDINIPYIIHAPHSYSGLNLSIKECETKNRALIEETDCFQETLKPARVIFHPGIEGSVNETIRQLHIFKKDYPKLFKSVVIENKPKTGLNGEVCVGASPKEIEQIIKETSLGFCLDFGHAIFYSAWADKICEQVIDRFQKLNPDMYHLSDGYIESKTDMHLNFGVGDFELGTILQKIPMDSHVTIETNRSITTNLKEFSRDILYLGKFLRNKNKLSLRLATMQDSDLLLQWRNDPQTQQASHNGEKVEKAEHIKWLSSVLQSKDRKIYLAEKDGQLVGTVREDYSDSTCELSWTIAPDMRGKGFGAKMVALITNQSTTKIKAEIKKENKASIRIAENVGMIFEKERDGILYYSKKAALKGEN